MDFVYWNRADIFVQNYIKKGWLICYSDFKVTKILKELKIENT